MSSSFFNSVVALPVLPVLPALPVFFDEVVALPVFPRHFRFKYQSQFDRFYILRPWAVNVGSNAKFFMNVYFEKRWEQDITDLRRELRIPPPPAIPASLKKKKKTQAQK